MNTQQRHCTQCGAKLKPDVSFCENCGTRVAPVEIPIQPVARSGGGGKGALTGVLIAVLAIGGFWWMQNRDKEELTVNEPAASVSLEDWMIGQPWIKSITDSMPKGVSLMIFSEPSDEPGWSEVELRESHSVDSGYDPDVAPMIGMFKVSDDRKTVLWFDPVSGEYQALENFLNL